MGCDYQAVRHDNERRYGTDIEHGFYRPVMGEQVEPYLLQRGDLLFTRYNGSPHPVGMCGMVARVVAEELISPKCLALCANVGAARRHVERRVKTSAGQHGISGADLRSAPIPRPSSEEQAVIVERVGT